MNPSLAMPGAGTSKMPLRTLWATRVTPTCAPHSHHNAFAGRALLLIVQDGGLHYHARMMGIEFLAAGA